MESIIKNRLLQRVHICILAMIIGLALSGFTAFPIQTELQFFIAHHRDAGLLNDWLTRVYRGITSANKDFPFLSYGTDWLAFAHLMLAILFFGPLKNPVKNKWVVEFGIIAAICIFPLAFIAGGIRGIPIFWRLIDCSFGVVALLLLLPCYRIIIKLEKLP